jgi:CRP-like cAMP-binding protein
MKEEDVAALRPHLRELYVARGQILIAENAHVTHVYFPSSAVLSSVIVLRDGRQCEVSTLGTEGLGGGLACLTGEASTERLFAQIAGGVIGLPADALKARALASPALLNLLLQRLQASQAEAGQGVACNALHEAPARLARWLLMTMDRTGTSEFPLTQTYLAVMVGVQRTTISGVANRLKQKGLIAYSRGQMTILDPAGLEVEACECYAVIRNRSDALGLIDYCD